MEQIQNHQMHPKAVYTNPSEADLQRFGQHKFIPANHLTTYPKESQESTNSDLEEEQTDRDHHLLRENKSVSNLMGHKRQSSRVLSSRRRSKYVQLNQNAHQFINEPSVVTQQNQITTQGYEDSLALATAPDIIPQNNPKGGQNRESKKNKMFGWGLNDFHQLGQQESSKTNGNKFFRIQGIKFNPVSASCGLKHSVLVGDDGSVWAVGDNSCGQLAFATRDQPILSQFRQVHVYSNQKVVQVECGDFHTVIKTESGHFYGCGLNSQFQIGVESSSPVLEELCLIPLPAVSFEVFKCGSHSTVFFSKSSNQLYVCGNQAKLVNISFPSHLTSIGISDVAMSSSSLFILCENGSLYQKQSSANGFEHKLCHHQIKELAFCAEFFSVVTHKGQILQWQGDNTENVQKINDGGISSSQMHDLKVGNGFGFVKDGNGKLLVWGMNEHGQLGPRDNAHREMLSYFNFKEKYSSALEVFLGHAFCLGIANRRGRDQKSSSKASVHVKSVQFDQTMDHEQESGFLVRRASQEQRHVQIQQTHQAIERYRDHIYDYKQQIGALKHLSAATNSQPVGYDSRHEEGSYSIAHYPRPNQNVSICKFSDTRENKGSLQIVFDNERHKRKETIQSEFQQYLMSDNQTDDLTSLVDKQHSFSQLQHVFDERKEELRPYMAKASETSWVRSNNSWKECASQEEVASIKKERAMKAEKAGIDPRVLVKSLNKEGSGHRREPLHGPIVNQLDSYSPLFPLQMPNHENHANIAFRPGARNSVSLDLQAYNLPFMHHQKLTSQQIDRQASANSSSFMASLESQSKVSTALQEFVQRKEGKQKTQHIRASSRYNYHEFMKHKQAQVKACMAPLDSQSTDTKWLLNDEQPSYQQDTYDLTQSNQASIHTIGQTTFSRTQNLTSAMETGQKHEKSQRIPENPIDIVGSRNLNRTYEPAHISSFTRTAEKAANHPYQHPQPKDTGRTSDQNVSKLNKYKRKLKKYMKHNESVRKELSMVMAQNLALRDRQEAFMHEMKQEDESTLGLIYAEQVKYSRLHEAAQLERSQKQEVIQNLSQENYHLIKQLRTTEGALAQGQVRFESLQNKNREMSETMQQLSRGQGELVSENEGMKSHVSELKGRLRKSKERKEKFVPLHVHNQMIESFEEKIRELKDVMRWQDERGMIKQGEITAVKKKLKHSMKDTQEMHDIIQQLKDKLDGQQPIQNIDFQSFGGTKSEARLKVIQNEITQALKRNQEGRHNTIDHHHGDEIEFQDQSEMYYDQRRSTIDPNRDIYLDQMMPQARNGHGQQFDPKYRSRSALATSEENFLMTTQNNSQTSEATLATIQIQDTKGIKVENAYLQTRSRKAKSPHNARQAVDLPLNHSMELPKRNRTRSVPPAKEDVKHQKYGKHTHQKAPQQQVTSFVPQIIQQSSNSHMDMPLQSQHRPFRPKPAQNMKIIDEGKYVAFKESLGHQKQQVVRRNQESTGQLMMSNQFPTFQNGADQASSMFKNESQEESYLLPSEHAELFAGKRLFANLDSNPRFIDDDSNRTSELISPQTTDKFNMPSTLGQTQLLGAAAQVMSLSSTLSTSDLRTNLISPEQNPYQCFTQPPAQLEATSLSNTNGQLVIPTQQSSVSSLQPVEKYKGQILSKMTMKATSTIVQGIKKRDEVYRSDMQARGSQQSTPLPISPSSSRPDIENYQIQQVKPCFASKEQILSNEKRSYGNLRSQEGQERLLQQKEAKRQNQEQNDKIINDFKRSSKRWDTRQGISPENYSKEEVENRYKAAFNGLTDEIKRKMEQGAARGRQVESGTLEASMSDRYMQFDA